MKSVISQHSFFLANQDSSSAAIRQKQQSAGFFLANQDSHQQQAARGIPQPCFSAPTRIPHQQLQTSSRNPEFFLAIQGSQQQQATSGIPQPSFSWPARIPHHQLETSNSNMQQFFWQTGVPSSSRQRQASFPSLVFPRQPGFPTSSYKPAAAICRSFPC